MKTTWRKKIQEEMNINGDSFDNLIGSIFDDDIDDEFEDGYGGTQGCEFQLWTTNYVYFPICYDGSEWVGSANRHVVNASLAHQGG
jgi:hypothetical protein